MSYAALIFGLGLLYPLLHLVNSWVFGFAELTPNIGLIYLPAFLRLLNVLVLGKLRGTLCTLLGSFFVLLINTQDPLYLKVLHTLCSPLGPLLGLLLFEYLFKRTVNLLSLKDLAVVTLLYSLVNAVVHHFAWTLFAPHLLGNINQIMGMALGDFTGTLIGAYLLKWAAERLGIADPPRK